MAAAISITSTDRRRLVNRGTAIAASAIASATGAAPAPLPDADARLIALLASAMQAWDDYERHDRAAAEAKARGDKAARRLRAKANVAWADWNHAITSMAEIRAAGPLGLAAKVSPTQMLRRYLTSGIGVEDAALLVSAAEDAARLLGRLAPLAPATAAEPSPDAELLALCAQWSDTVSRRGSAAEAERLVAAVTGLRGRTPLGREAKAGILQHGTALAEDGMAQLAHSLATDLVQASYAS